MEIAMLIIGLLLGGCVSFCILDVCRSTALTTMRSRYASFVPKREPK